MSQYVSIKVSNIFLEKKKHSQEAELSATGAIRAKLG